MKTKVITLEGPVRVVYRKDDDWYATAVEFDLVGHGATKQDALRMLHELVSTYLYEVAVLLRDNRPVKFLNPSDASEWNDAESDELYSVQFMLKTNSSAVSGSVKHQGLGRLIEAINSLDDFSVALVPA